MSINRSLFEDAFTSNRIPAWICPTCKIGILKADKNDIKVYESSASKSIHNHPAWEPDWMYGGFVGLLTCSNPNCSEKVGIIGDMHFVEKQEYSEDLDEWVYVRQNELNPTQFSPAINIFQINKDVPRKLAEAIYSSFSLYWIDLSSCANKIRTVAECIMDNKKVPKIYMDKGKRKSYTLHKRIELFKETNTEEAELLMAIKWIGNSGSHQTDNLTDDDILDSFELLELVTNKLYETDSTRIKKLSKNINKRKKPIGKKKK